MGETACWENSSRRLDPDPGFESHSLLVQAAAVIVESLDAVDGVSSRRLSIDGHVRVTRVECCSTVVADEVSEPDRSTGVPGVNQVVSLIEPEVGLVPDVPVGVVCDRYEHAAIDGGLRMFLVLTYRFDIAPNPK